jgi:hypothetical protein
MNRFRIVASVFLLACFSFAVSGQKPVAKLKPVSKKTVLCQINGVSFSCPKGFSAFFRDEPSGLQLFRSNADKNFGLFILVSNQASDEKELLINVTKTVAAKLFPKQSSDYAWKDGDVVRFGDNETPMSENQTRSETIRGYNKNHLLFANFRHIEFKNKKFFVGYVIETANGKDAEELFAEELSDAGYQTCDAQMKLIYSITGEKIKKGDVPCGVTVEVAASP